MDSTGKTYSIKVVGVTFENRQEVCKKISIGDKIQLACEPDNPYDSNAIKVLHNGSQFGYLPKEIAPEIITFIDSETIFNKAVVANLTGGGEYNIGVHIDLFFSNIKQKDIISMKSNPRSNKKNTLGVMNYEDLIRSAVNNNTKDDLTNRQIMHEENSEFQLTDEQKDIIEYDLKTGETIKVIAFAGTGKTTTLLEYSRTYKNTRFLYIAFNRSVRESAENKFPPNVLCKTSHGLAYQKFGGRYKNKLITNLKLNTIKSVLGLESYDVTKTVNEIFNTFLISTEDSFSENLLRWDPVDLSNEDYFHLAKAKQLWEMMIDPNDNTVGMLHDGYLKLYQLSKPNLNYDCLLLDEAQDTNPVVIDIVVKQKCSKILVGDPHQQIYGFRGASDAMEKINASKTFYLTNCFRFGEEIAWIANKILRFYKNEKIELKGVRDKEVLDKDKNFGIIARTNAVVFDQAASNCDINKIAFLGGIDGYKFNDILDVYHLYTKNNQKISNPYIRNFSDYLSLKVYAEKVEDWELKSKCKIIEKYEYDIPQTIDRIKKSEVNINEADVILTTVHKAKGAEFTYVKLCDDFHSFYEDPLNNNLTKIPPEEANLLYVAVTRAKQNLCFVDTFNWKRFIRHNDTNGANRIISFLYQDHSNASNNGRSGPNQKASNNNKKTNYYIPSNVKRCSKSKEIIKLIKSFVEMNGPYAQGFIMDHICSYYPFNFSQIEKYRKKIYPFYFDKNKNVSPKKHELFWTEEMFESFVDDYGAWYLVSMAKRLPWNVKLIEKYKNKWDWTELSKNNSFPWNFELLEKYKDKWDWTELSKNNPLPWNLELLEKFKDKWDWTELSKNNPLPWNLELLEKFKDKWDWTELSKNNSLPWSENLIDRFEPFWDWNDLAINSGVNWNMNWIEKYRNRITIPKIMKNASFEAGLEFFIRYEDEINFEECSSCIVSGIKWDIELLERYRHKWLWTELSYNVILPWDHELIERYRHKWLWTALSNNEALPWDHELIERFAGLWDFKILSSNRAIKWNEYMVERYKDKLDWESYQFNRKIDIDWEVLIDRYADKLSWSYLSCNENLQWCDDFIERYKSKWDWDSLSGNSSLSLSEDYIIQNKTKFHWFNVIAYQTPIPWSLNLLINCFPEFDKSSDDYGDYTGHIPKKSIWEATFKTIFNDEIVDAFFEMYD